ncbi:MAG TPA: hypothetical protein VMF86_12475 [Stellaceae bacterium]|nr:hypothetical protein [Stellaceae bacterium]
MVGYDRQTDRANIRFDVPRRLLSEAKRIAQVPDDDPQAAWSYPLSIDQTRDVAALIGAAVDPNHGEFFLEAFAIG